MVELHWPENVVFLAPSGQYVGPGTFEVPDDREEEFRKRGWEDPSTDEDDTESAPVDTGAPEDDFERLDGVGAATADHLREDDYETFADLREASVERLTHTENVTQSLAEGIHEQLAGENQP